MTETGLPPNWAIRYSKTQNYEYFLNQATGELVWDAPFGADEAKLKAYLAQYRANGNKPVVAADGKVRASHLLVKSKESRRPKSWKHPEGITITRDEAITAIKAYRRRILAGETTLEELAKDESDCSSHAQGGDLGFFGKGQMQPSFEEAAYGLNVGELSDVIESDSGVHIVLRTA